MGNYLIRRAEEQDSDGILSCLHDAFEPFREQYTPEAYADTVLDPETIRTRLREMRLLVAVAEGEIVGTIGCGFNGAEGHLRGMAVLAAWQGTGVASALLRAAEEELARNGCSMVTLDTTEPLQRAIHFYERHGYRASGKVVDFFGMPLYEYSKPHRTSGASAEREPCSGK